MIDPVCGMQVDPAAGKPVHEHAGTIYHFCCEGCRRKFAENPQHYLDAQASAAPDVGDAPPGTFWICPMDPEVRQDHPGACPKCGMALEPESPQLGMEDDSELRDMRRRFAAGLALSVPLLWLAMGEMLPGALNPLYWLAPRVDAALQLLLAAPVVLWAGAPFWQRAWASLRNRSLNMFTLIGLGVASAFGFSLVALLFPASLPGGHAHGMPAVYFEAAAVITTLALLGQVLELRRSAGHTSELPSLMALTDRKSTRLHSIQ